MDYFIHIEMWSAVTLVLHRNTTIIKAMDLDMKVMADFLSMTGWHCTLPSLWGMLCNEQELLAAV
eukprot:10347309-Ditylum_brightwellii.AAC.1